MKTRLLLVIGVLLSLAACGGEGSAGTTTETSTVTPTSPSATPTVRPDLTGLSGAQLAVKALTALRAAKTVRISGTDENGITNLDASFGRTGATVILMTDNGSRIELITVGKVVYMKASDSIWRATGGKKHGNVWVAVLSGRWLKGTSTDEVFSEFTEFMGIKELVDQLAAHWPKSPDKVGVKTINGAECIGLADPDGILWVDKYTARSVQAGPEVGSKDKARINFSQYDAVREPVAPPASVVIDSSKLW